MKRCCCGEEARDEAMQCVCGLTFPTGAHAMVHPRWFTGCPDGTSGDDKSSRETSDFSTTTMAMRARSSSAERPSPVKTILTLFWAGLGVMFLVSGIFAILLPFVAGAALACSAGSFAIAGWISARQKGTCPYCGEPGAAVPPAFNCAACQGRVLVRGGLFLPAPPRD